MNALVLAAAMTLGLQEREPSRPIDLVFCIDRSGSMQQVIDTAKRKVWGIVNEIAVARPAPALRIGLIGYGSADRDIKFFPLNGDLDRMYENLLTFKVDMGGDEWVGWAVRQAVERMEWSPDPKALKIIFVVGNETAAQGREDVLYTRTVPEAIARGIMVNAIYCGRPSSEEERTWREVAALADGQYAAIDLSGGAVTLETPMDARLLELNRQLNATYVPFGRDGARRKELQEAQDRTTAASGAPAAAERAAAKAKSVYQASSWDLVDASRQPDFKLEEVRDEDLPEEMRPLSLEERRARLEKLCRERDAVRAEINRLDAERARFIQEEMRRRNLSAEGAFDEAIRRAVRAQAARKGFSFEEPATDK
jgi:hypothetical protein